MSDCDVAVYGATGHTGKLVCHALARRGIGFVMSGRNSERLHELADLLRQEYHISLEVRVADASNSVALDDVLQGIRVLINCAGPFGDVGKPIARAAVRNGVHYLDSTGEQDFMFWLYQELHDEAVRSGVVLLSGCAFEYAVGDFAAECALEIGASRIAVCYAPQSMSMSQGTKRSILRVLANPGYSYINGALARKNIAYRTFDVPFPDGTIRKGVWIPGGEPLLVPLRGGVIQVESAVIVDKKVATFLKAVSVGIPLVMRIVLPFASRLVDRVSKSHSSSSDLVPSHFSVLAFHPETSQLYAALTGGDPYVVTAEILAEAAKIVRISPPNRLGFTSPAAIFARDSFLEAVGVHYTIAE